MYSFNPKLYHWIIADNLIIYEMFLKLLSSFF